MQRIVYGCRSAATRLDELESSSPSEKPVSRRIENPVGKKISGMEAEGKA